MFKNFKPKNESKILPALIKKVTDNGKLLQVPLEFRKNSKCSATKPAFAGKPLERQLPDEEKQTLIYLFKKYPELIKNNKNLMHTDKQQLRQMAEKIFAQNHAQIRKKQAEYDFHRSLHSNMLRETGMLEVMATMLEAARKQETVKWQIFCGYAQQQMTSLLELENAAKCSIQASDKSSKMPIPKLVDEIEQQMLFLRQPLQKSEYLPLYESMKQITFNKECNVSLAEWFEEASILVRQGLAALEPRLRAAILKKYPTLHFSLADV